MKNIIATLTMLCCAICTFAGDGPAVSQSTTSAGASQTIQLVLADGIEIGFANGGNNGGIIQLAFANNSNYATGMESADQQLVVRSNRKFEVKMQPASEVFSYSGSTNNAPAMRVEDVLSLMVSDNSTGGQNNYPQYHNVNGGNTRILTNCSNGSNQTFSVRYRANPGMRYAAGTYTVNMVYTATQS
jgi:hypothetical protein